MEELGDVHFLHLFSFASKKLTAMAPSIRSWGTWMSSAGFQPENLSLSLSIPVASMWLRAPTNPLALSPPESLASIPHVLRRTVQTLLKINVFIQTTHDFLLKVLNIILRCFQNGFCIS